MKIAELSRARLLEFELKNPLVKGRTKSLEAYASRYPLSETISCAGLTLECLAEASTRESYKLHLPSVQELSPILNLGEWFSKLDSGFFNNIYGSAIFYAKVRDGFLTSVTDALKNDPKILGDTKKKGKLFKRLFPDKSTYQRFMIYDTLMDETKLGGRYISERDSAISGLHKLIGENIGDGVYPTGIPTRTSVPLGMSMAVINSSIYENTRTPEERIRQSYNDLLIDDLKLLSIFGFSDPFQILPDDKEEFLKLVQKKADDFTQAELRFAPIAREFLDREADNLFS